MLEGSSSSRTFARAASAPAAAAWKKPLLLGILSNFTTPFFVMYTGVCSRKRCVMNRRHFLMTSLATGAAVRSARPSPNDTIRVACVGLRGRGTAHIQAWPKIPNVEIAALCDVDESVLAQRLKDVERATGKRPATFTDLRKLLEDKSIDAISIATPNHNHTLQTIWGCQAGK